MVDSCWWKKSPRLSILIPYRFTDITKFDWIPASQSHNLRSVTIWWLEKSDPKISSHMVVHGDESHGIESVKNTN